VVGAYFFASGTKRRSFKKKTDRLSSPPFSFCGSPFRAFPRIWWPTPAALAVVVAFREMRPPS